MSAADDNNNNDDETAQTNDWKNTREAAEKFRQLLLCSKWYVVCICLLILAGCFF